MITAIVLALLFCMLFIGTPVALALAIAGSLGLYMMGGAPMLLGILQTTPPLTEEHSCKDHLRGCASST